MSETLVKVGAVGAVASGALLIVQEALYYAFGDSSATLATVGSLMYAVTVPLTTFALVGLYLRQAGAAGRFGVVAFLTALLGQLLLAGIVWVDLFVEPAAPTLFEDPPAVMITGFLASLGVYAVGWLLFGIATLRARVFPRAAAALLTAGVVVGFVFTEFVEVPGALWLWYAAWMWLGIAALRPARTTAPEAAEELQVGPPAVR